MTVSLFIIIAILCIWILIVYLIKEKGGDAFSIWGPILLWKTEKGKALIERIAKKGEFWKRYADLAIIICSISMILMFLLILWNVNLSFKISPKNAPSPRMLIGLPGLNPIIPIGYGVVAIAVAIIIHEFSHGILAMVEKIKVKALGLIFFIFPIGAFVEPDEEELEKVSRKKRSHVFAAGPMSNLLLAFICALLFSSVFMASVTPKVEGALITGEVQDSPLAAENIKPWSVIVSFNGTEIRNVSNFEKVIESIHPGKEYNFTFFFNGKWYDKNILGGMVVAMVADGYPADKAGIKEGDVIYKINDTTITNESTFFTAMNKTKSGKEIMVQYFRYNNGKYTLHVTPVTLEDKYSYYQKYNPEGNKEWYKGKGFIGLNIIAFGISVAPVDYYPERLAHPLKSMNSFFFYIALPFAGLSPFPKDFASLYTTPFSAPLFWVLSNLLYWLFWLNFAVGTFNVLPAIPLDGGYIFRDGISYAIEKMKGNWKKEKLDKVTHAITMFFSIIVLLSIVAIILIPRLRLLF